MGNISSGQCMHCEYFATFGTSGVCNAFHVLEEKRDECADFEEKDYFAAKDRDEEIRKRVRSEPAPAKVALRTAEGLASTEEGCGTRFSQNVIKWAHIFSQITNNRG